MTQPIATGQATEPAVDNSAIRPFTFSFPDSELAELRRRVNATRWPEKETVTDATQGVQLATMQKLASYWATQYDWRKVEDTLPTIDDKRSVYEVLRLIENRKIGGVQALFAAAHEGQPKVQNKSAISLS